MITGVSPLCFIICSVNPDKPLLADCGIPIFTVLPASGAGPDIYNRIRKNLWGLILLEIKSALYGNYIILLEAGQGISYTLGNTITSNEPYISSTSRNAIRLLFFVVSIFAGNDTCYSDFHSVRYIARIRLYLCQGCHLSESQASLCALYARLTGATSDILPGFLFPLQQVSP